MCIIIAHTHVYVKWVCVYNIIIHIKIDLCQKMFRFILTKTSMVCYNVFMQQEQEDIKMLPVKKQRAFFFYRCQFCECSLDNKQKVFAILQIILNWQQLFVPKCCSAFHSAPWLISI